MQNLTHLAQLDFGNAMVLVLVVIGAVVLIGFLAMLVKCYQKVEQGTAIVRNGVGGSKVSFSGIFVIPILHRAERMEISVKRVEIARTSDDGLVCKDNMRADTKVAFFVRVNKTPQDVLAVAQTVGCERASDVVALRELFDAKFSEALKTVGKKFDFVQLYEERESFKDEIIKVIGTDLNGYVLDDCAIDYLEQTPMDKMDPNNILDAEGIKKIADLTAKQQILANEILRNKEKIITKQDVEAREAILELERQKVEAEQKQKREIATVTAREDAEARKVEAEELLKSERARIATEEEVEVATQNKDRQVVVAEKNKERTTAVEIERIEKDRQLEVTERERIVTLAQIEKDKAVEVEKKNIQDVIRDRVIVERAVVEEQEKIKDTQEFATADRQKQVAVTLAQETAEQAAVKEIRAAEAAKIAAERDAERVLIDASAELEASEKQSEARKRLAEAQAAEEAAIGLAEVQVMEAKADATEKYGAAEAQVLLAKASAEAEGITQKAAAMEKFNESSKDHEEFRLRLALEKDLQIADIDARKEIARDQAGVISTALESARIDIVGGDAQFFDRIVNSVGQGKGIDRMVESSRVLTDVKETFFDGTPDGFRNGLEQFIGRFGLSTDDVRNLSVSALIFKLMGLADTDDMKDRLQSMLGMAQTYGVADQPFDKLAAKLGVRPSDN